MKLFPMPLRARFVICCAVLSLLGASPQAWAQAPVAADAHVVAGSTTNVGGANKLVLNVAAQRVAASDVYLRLDLSRLPSGATADSITKATLRLYISQVSAPGSFDVYVVASPWSELGITDTNRPALGPVALSEVPVTAKDNYVLLDVTAVVKAWIGNATPNHGLALIPSAGSPISVTFDSKETTATSHDAEVQVDYTDQAVLDSLAAVDSRISSEVLDRQNGDVSTLAQANAYTNAQIISEAAERMAADTSLSAALSSQVAQIQAGLDAETAARAAADLSLQSQIQGEVVQRMVEDASLHTVLDPIAANVRVGGDNTALGEGAMWSFGPTLIGQRNTAIGFVSLASSTGGIANTALGAAALVSNRIGSYNVAAGDAALAQGESGSFNVALGHAALVSSRGSHNTAVGNTAGEGLQTGDHNIYLGATGVPAEESNTIRIGTPASHNRAFLSGVWNTSLSGETQLVAIDNTGQLGTTSAVALTGTLQEQLNTLATAGTINAPANLVDWTQLKNVPTPLASGNFALLNGGNAFIGNQAITGDLNTTGNVGIGGTDIVGGYKSLHVQGGSTGSFVSVGHGAGIGRLVFDVNGFLIASTTPTRLRLKAGNPIDGIDSHMTLLPSGNLGLGTPAPEAVPGYTSLHINHAVNGGFLQLSRGSSLGRIAYDQFGFMFGSWGNLPIRFKAGPVNGGTDSHLMLLTNGNFGIGTPTPADRLHVLGNTTVSGRVRAGTFEGDGSALTGIATPAALEAETTRALAAEAALDTAIGAETTRATLAEGTLASIIASHQSLLATAGTINSPTNPMDWSQLKNVPAALTGDDYAVKSQPNTFTAPQTIEGTLTLAGPTGAILFPDGTRQSTAGVAAASTLNLGAQKATLKRHWRQRFAVPVANPTALVFDGESIWVGCEVCGTLAKLRATDGSVVATFPINAWSMASDGAHLWVADHFTLRKLRTSDGAVLATITEAGGRPFGRIGQIVSDGVSVYVADAGSRWVYKLDLNGAMQAQQAIAYPPWALAFEGANLFVGTDGPIYLLDADTLEGSILYSSNGQSRALAFDGAFLWVVTGNHLLQKFNYTGLLWQIALGVDPVGVLYDGRYIWATSRANGHAYRFDLNGTFLGSFNIGGPTALAFDGANVWITGYYSGTVVRF